VGDVLPFKAFVFYKAEPESSSCFPLYLIFCGLSRFYKIGAIFILSSIFCPLRSATLGGRTTRLSAATPL